MKSKMLSPDVLYSLIFDRNWDRIAAALEDGLVMPDKCYTIRTVTQKHSFYLLPIAVQHNAKSLVQKLVESGVNPNRKDEGETALIRACEEGNHEMIELLISAGADLSISATVYGGEGGETPLIISAEKGDDWAVGKLIAAGADPSQQNKRNGFNAAWYATSEGSDDTIASRKKILDILFEAGCNFTGNELHWPVFRRKSELVEKLLDLGCPCDSLVTKSYPNGPEKGRTPLMLAVETNSLDMASFSEKPAGKKVEIVKLLLEAGAQVNVQTAKGIHPLVLVVAGHELEQAMDLPSRGTSEQITKMLLEAGADPHMSIANSKHGSPLDFAREKGSALVRLLEARA